MEGLWSDHPGDGVGRGRSPLSRATGNANGDAVFTASAVCAKGPGRRGREGCARGQTTTSPLRWDSHWFYLVMKKKKVRGGQPPWAHPPPPQPSGAVRALASQTALLRAPRLPPTFLQTQASCGRTLDAAAMQAAGPVVREPAAAAGGNCSGADPLGLHRRGESPVPPGLRLALPGAPARRRAESSCTAGSPASTHPGLSGTEKCLGP